MGQGESTCTGGVPTSCIPVFSSAWCFLLAYLTTMPSGTEGVQPSKGLRPNLESDRSFLALFTYCEMPPGVSAYKWTHLKAKV
jgi:hypothetical protein